MLSTQISQVEAFEQSGCDFSSLRHRPIFTVMLSSSYIANGRFVSANELEVWILDNSELVETMRVGASVQFEIDLLEGCRLQGVASVQLGESRVGKYEKRYVEVRLRLESAFEEENAAPMAKWLT